MVDTAQWREWRELARRDLGRYREAQKDIRHFEQLIAKLQERAAGYGRSMQPDKVQTQPRPDRAEAALAHIMDLQRDLQIMQADAEQLCMEIAVRIGELDNPLHQRILRAHWLFGQRFEQIAVDETYSMRQVLRLHDCALEVYGEKMSLHVT